MRSENEKTSYPGGKAGSGVYQQLINLMPPHETYVEGFLGAGAVMKIKRPAAHSIGIEINRQIAAAWRSNHDGPPGLHVICTDFLKWITEPMLRHIPLSAKTLIYLDPPYLMSVRSCKRPMYEHEFHTEAEHIELLETIKTLPCMVMISGYDSDLYNSRLAAWRKVQFTGVSRRGPTVETVYLNFPEPMQLHDYQFLGSTYRKRQDLRRLKKRWIDRLTAMPPQKRYAVLAAIDEFTRGGSGTAAVAFQKLKAEVSRRRADTGENAVELECKY